MTGMALRVYLAGRTTIFARAGECLAETTIRNGEPTVAIDVAEEGLAA